MARKKKKPAGATAKGGRPGYQRKIKLLAVKYHLNLCIECGKCSAACTMAELFPDYDYDISPRGNVEKALRGEDLLEGRSAWYCLTCDVCTAACPNGVEYRDFMEALRSWAAAEGLADMGAHCGRCGKYFIPEHTVEYLKALLQDKLKDRQTAETLHTCPTCRKYVISQKIKDTLQVGKRK